MTRTRGFTLTEVSVAMALLVILGAVSTPYLLSSLPLYRVNGAARQMVADFRLAKATAVEKGKNVLVQFDTAAETYTVVSDENGNDTVDVPPDVVIKTVTIPALYKGIGFPSYSGGTNPSGDPLPDDGVSFQDDLARFSPTGGARAGAVYLRPDRDAGTRSVRERGITVTVATGRARVYQWTGSAWE